LNGAECSIQRSFPSITKSTRVTRAAGTLGYASQRDRWGSTLLPSMLDLTCTARALSPPNAEVIAIKPATAVSRKNVALDIERTSLLVGRSFDVRPELL
jgi:hypothetical protein